MNPLPVAMVEPGAPVIRNFEEYVEAVVPRVMVESEWDGM